MTNESKIKTLSLYKNSGWKKIFAYIRFWDAPLIEVEKLIPRKGIIAELGCGDGIFSNYLAISSPSRQIIGIDIDQNRLKQADKELKNAKYIVGDIRKITIPISNAIILFHVLHHLSSFDEQKELIKTCRNRLNKGGKLIIVEIHVTANPKYWLGWFFDHMLVPIFFEKRLYSKIYYRTQEGWENLLKEAGFSAEIISLTPSKPISNIAIICRNEEKN